MVFRLHLSIARWYTLQRSDDFVRNLDEFVFRGGIPLRGQYVHLANHQRTTEPLVRSAVGTVIRHLRDINGW